MTRTERHWLAIVFALGAGLCASSSTGCASLPAIKTPPCDEATLAQIMASCSSEADCNAKLDQRQSTCSKRIKEEK